MTLFGIFFNILSFVYIFNLILAQVLENKFETHTFKIKLSVNIAEILLHFIESRIIL